MIFNLTTAQRPDGSSWPLTHETRVILRFTIIIICGEETQHLLWIWHHDSTEVTWWTYWHIDLFYAFVLITLYVFFCFMFICSSCVWMCSGDDSDLTSTFSSLDLLLNIGKMFFQLHCLPQWFSTFLGSCTPCTFLMDPESKIETLKDNWPSALSSATLSRGIMGGEVWMPDLYHRRSTMRKTVLRMNIRKKC